MDLRAENEIRMLTKLGVPEEDATIVVLGKNSNTLNPVINDLINLKKQNNEILKEEIKNFAPAEENYAKMNFSYSDKTLSKIHQIPIQKVASFRRLSVSEE